MIVLASASATRAELLKNAGVALRIAAPRVDEAEIKTRLVAEGQSPRRVAEALAEAKALAAPADAEDLVIGADQTLELDGMLIDKAPDLAAARDTLQRLRGKTHWLHSAAALARGGAVVWRATSSPRLLMRAFSDAFLDAYLKQCGAAACSVVGAYHLEGPGAQLFEDVEGDLFAVMGLPLMAVLGGLRSHGGLPA